MGDMPPERARITMTRYLTTLALMLASSIVLAQPLLAQPLPATPAPEHREPAPAAITPAMQLRMGMDSLLAFMNQDPRPAAPAIARFLDGEIAPFFDFEHMARSAGGRLYTQLSPQQRDEMADEIKHLFLTRLTQKLASYGGQQVRYLPTRIAPDGQQAVVSMMVLDPGSYYPSRIDFRLIGGKQGWAIIDIAANGQSAVMYYRQQLERERMMRAYRARQQAMQRYYAHPRGE